MRFAIGPGQQNDMAAACGLVQGLSASQVIADRAYDATVQKPFRNRTVSRAKFDTSHLSETDNSAVSPSETAQSAPEDMPTLAQARYPQQRVKEMSAIAERTALAFTAYAFPPFST